MKHQHWPAPDEDDLFLPGIVVGLVVGLTAGSAVWWLPLLVGLVL